MDIYRAKGVVRFFYDNGKMMFVDRDYEPCEIEMHVNDHRIYSLIDGKDFLEDVKCGGFIDSDGKLVDVFVDGCVSNLGLCCNGICQGGFLLGESEWEEMCEFSKVEVNWANK